METESCFLKSLFRKELISLFVLSLLDLGAFGRPSTLTKNALCQLIPSQAELAEVPDNVPLQNTSFAPVYLYRQRLELVDYVPRKTVLVSMVENANPVQSVGLYIPEARLATTRDSHTTNRVRIGRFKSPSSDVELRRCGDIDVHLVLSQEVYNEEGDWGGEQGITLEWHPPDEDVGPVDIFITKLNFKKLNRRRWYDRRLP